MASALNNLRILVPAAITDSVLTASSIPETDYTAWATATGYVVGDTRIYVAANVHWVIVCIAAHTSLAGGPNDPIKDINATSGAGVFWLRFSSTNKWKAFDQKIGDQAALAGSITYTLVAAQVSTAVFFFNLTANTIRVRVVETATSIVRYDTTASALEIGGIIDWWSYFYSPIVYKSEAAFLNVPIFIGDTVTITIAGLATNKVGEIVMGVDYQLGTAIWPIAVGILDYSTKDRDTFGNPYITPRAFASRAEYKAWLLTTDANRVKKLLASIRATPVVFYTNAIVSFNDFGATLYGLYKSFDIDEIHNNASYLSIQAEGLI